MVCHSLLIELRQLNLSYVNLSHVAYTEVYNFAFYGIFLIAKIDKLCELATIKPYFRIWLNQL